MNQAPDELPLHAQLVQMASGFWISRTVYAAAELRLPEHLADGGKTAADLSEATGVPERNLHRLMRTLASLGILTETPPKHFSLTDLGQALHPSAPGGAYAAVMMMAGQTSWQGWEHFLHSLRTSQTGIEKAHGKKLFSYLADHPQEAEIFTQAMIGFHGTEPAAVAAAMDFSSFGTVVDVGGASGHTLTTILEHHNTPRGIVFDLPHVVKDAAATIDQKGMSDRVTTRGGSFFEAVPEGGDAYILSHIIHDWNEDECITILGNCRQAMNADGKVLIVEMVLPEGDTPHLGKLLDMVMLAMPGGEERTEAEYAGLLEKAGLQLEQVVPTESPVSVVVAKPA